MTNINKNRLYACGAVRLWSGMPVEPYTFGALCLWSATPQRTCFSIISQSREVQGFPKKTPVSPVVMIRNVKKCEILTFNILEIGRLFGKPHTALLHMERGCRYVVWWGPI